MELDTRVTNPTTTNLNYKVMKAKEAPEKLYLLPNGLISYCRSTDEDIEYISKDTFVEKTEEYMYKQLNEGHIECANIGTFLENYKKFMKGE